MLLYYVLFAYSLAETKNFSVLTQSNIISIINVLDAVENTKQTYELLQRNLNRDQ